MLLYAILIIVLAILAFVVWFLYIMGHPRLGEPRFIHNWCRRPSAIPEYIALLAHGLFHPHMLRTGSTHQDRVQALPGDDLLPNPKWQQTHAATIDIPAAHLWSHQIDPEQVFSF